VFTPAGKGKGKKVELERAPRGGANTSGTLDFARVESSQAFRQAEVILRKEEGQAQERLLASGASANWLNWVERPRCTVVTQATRRVCKL
jgi:hypothetical protein